MRAKATIEVSPCGNRSDEECVDSVSKCSRVGILASQKPARIEGLAIFSAVHVVQGEMRRVFFEAIDDQEARELCVRWGCGLEGKSTRPEPGRESVPEAYDQETACRLLGGISKSTLYRELQDGKLERVPGTRRILVTRSSLEARCAWRPTLLHR